MINFVMVIFGDIKYFNKNNTKSDNNYIYGIRQ